MTNEEKYKVIEEVCDEIRASLQTEAERLRDQADKWDENSSGWRLALRNEATCMVKAQINVSAVENRLKWRLICEEAEKTK